MSFSKIYQEKKDAFEAKLSEIFSSVRDIPEPLRASMEYSLLNGGKRLRPLLFLEIFKMFAGREPEESALKFAAAIECIHCYSLIHDDLPSMDNDDTRRGKPTNHKVYGEGIAVLAGDALLNLAYELIIESITAAEPKTGYLKAASVLSKNAGARGMIAGQTADITAEKGISVDVLKYVFRHKTGDLMIAACLSGAYIGGAGQDELMRIGSFADHFSYAFQIKDDILDYEEEEDKSNVSFVKFYGLPRAVQTLGDSTQKAQKELLALNGRDTSFLKQLVLKFASRKA